MKVIQIITLGHELYGAQRHVIDLCLSLQAEGHEVILLIGNAGKMEEYAQAIGIKTYVLKHLKRAIHPYHDFAGVLELIQLFKELKPDLVASHSSKAGILARIAAWWLKIPNTFTVHGWSFAEGSGVVARKTYQVIEKLTGLISDKIIVIAKADEEYALQLRVIKPTKMALIYHGIRPPDDFDKSADNESFVMVMAARFQAQKDHETLIEALIPLRDMNWQLYLLGDGELLHTMKEKVKKAGLLGKVFFEGAVDNVPEYLKKADVFLLITNWEGLPLSILEAMAHGLPVIATDVAGIKEEVINGVNGFLVPRKNAQSITSAIANLYHNRTMTIDMGKKSKERFEKYFTIDLMTSRTLALYRELTKK
jgi:glycosyltransferase involved in cell wall biosynthesis